MFDFINDCWQVIAKRKMVREQFFEERLEKPFKRNLLQNSDLDYVLVWRFEFTYDRWMTVLEKKSAIGYKMSIVDCDHVINVWFHLFPSKRDSTWFMAL